MMGLNSYALSTSLASYNVSIIVAVLFVHMARLKARLPEEVPGRIPVMAGLMLLAVLVVASVPRALRFVERQQPPHQPSVRRRGFCGVSSFFLAKLLVLIGVTQALLAASPRAADAFLGGKPPEGQSGR
jgi:hypothetical protein